MQGACGMQHISKLWGAGYNKLKVLPDSLSNCKDLTVIGFASNQVAAPCWTC